MSNNNDCNSSDYDSDYDSNYGVICDDSEKYVIKTRVCKRLSRELGLEEIKIDETAMVSYEPPKEHGLVNSDVIIPSYYGLYKNPMKFLNFDYLKMIEDNIRNYRPLSERELEYIKNLDHENKNKLFDIYNDMINSIQSVLNNL